MSGHFSFSSGFNPVQFLYLNPQQSNVVTVEDAYAFWNQNSNTTNLEINYDTVPSGLDPTVFIAENRASINISGLNNAIKNAMLANGDVLCDIERQGVYFPTVYRSLHVTGSNTFCVNIPGDPDVFQINLSNLQIGDAVKIINTASSQSMFGRITNILGDAQSFQIAFTGAHPNDLMQGPYLTNTYALFGIKLYDPLRLCRINYLALQTRNSNQPLTNLVDIDPTFNYELYHTLYPDSRNLNKEEAFVDYTNNNGNNNHRIANVSELLSSSVGANTSISSNLDHLQINQTLKLNFTQETGRVTWNDQDLYYVTNDSNRPYDTVSPYFPGLITEYAIKNNIHNLFYPLATFCNVNVTGVTALSNAAISNLKVANTAEFNCDVYANNNMFGGRIGVGLVPFNHVPVPIQSNIQADNIHINDTLYVGSTTEIAGPLIGGSGATFAHSVKGYKFGIGSDSPFPNTQQHDVGPNPVVIGDDTTTNQVMLTVNGIVTATNINTASDVKLKRNIAQASKMPSLPNVVTFSYHGESQRRYGFLAQELEEMFPEAVQTTTSYRLNINKVFKTVEMSVSTNRACIEMSSNYNLMPGDKLVIYKTSVGIISVGQDCVELDINTDSLQGFVPVSSIIYAEAKTVDYNQVLMALIMQVKQLQKQQATSHHCQD